MAQTANHSDKIGFAPNQQPAKMIFTQLKPLFTTDGGFDGNASCSSTFTVDIPAKEEQTLPFEFEPELDVPSRRSVCFNESCNKSYENTQRCAEDCVETWYTVEDYSAFRSDMRQLERKVLNGNDDGQDLFSTNLQQIYEAACEVDFDSDNATGTLTLEEEDQLTRVFINNMNLIGLEYYAVGSINKDTREQRKFIQYIVCYIQHENDILEDDVAEELRESCRNITRAARLFAQHLAQAQLLV
jgi:hypothetical protein